MTTFNPNQTSTYLLTTANNPITFGSATAINAGTQIGVSGQGAPNWNVTNQGSISGTTAIALAAKSTVTNAATGVITGTGSGATTGISLGGGGALTNLGHIT